MKTKLKTALVALALYATALTNTQAQCLPLIKIDANELVADENNPSGIKLPSWLAAGQTLAKGQNVYSIAVIEFTVNGTALDYSRNISVSTLQTVPAGKVWKVESIHKDPAYVPVVASYTTPGTYSFTPACSGNYLLQVWGAGGSGGIYGGGGGGGGGYSEGFFYLLSTNTYTLTVGAGGAATVYTGGSCGIVDGAVGGNSSFGILINASGGGKAIGGYPGYGGGCLNEGMGGVGGFGNSQSGTSGRNCTAGAVPALGGRGGGQLGGAGGSAPGQAGTAPGGGGHNGVWNTGTSGAGAAGSVIISLNANLGGSSRVPCTSLYLYSGATPPLCPSGWSDAGVGQFDGTAPATNCRTCFRCD